MREGKDLQELSLKHEKERELLEATFEVQEQEHLAELQKKISEEHKDALIENNRKQIAYVRGLIFILICFLHLEFHPSISQLAFLS